MPLKVLKINGTVQDSINFILQIIVRESNSDFVKKLAAQILAISGNSDFVSICKALFAFSCKIQYQYDDAGKEQLKSPERLVKDGKGDCDDYTILIGAVLEYLNIPFAVKVVDWSNDGYDHIYIVANNNGTNIILDPVTVTSGQMYNGGFNIEKTGYKRSALYFTNEKFKKKWK